MFLRHIVYICVFVSIHLMNKQPLTVGVLASSQIICSVFYCPIWQRGRWGESVLIFRTEGWYCVHSAGLRRRERRNKSGTAVHVTFISYHITVALFCLSVPRCLPKCDFPTIYPFTPTGFCSITLSVPLLHLHYLFHIIAS